MDLPGYEANGPSTTAEVDTITRRFTKDEQKRNIEVVLADRTNLFLMTPVLDGFSLESKAWSESNNDTSMQRL